MDLDPDVIHAIVNLGTLGPLLLAMGAYVLRREARFDEAMRELRTELKSSQDGRIADAQKVADRIVSLVERQNDVIGEQTRVLEGQSQMLDRLREAIERLPGRPR